MKKNERKVKQMLALFALRGMQIKISEFLENFNRIVSDFRKNETAEQC